MTDHAIRSITLGDDVGTWNVHYDDGTTDQVSEWSDAMRAWHRAFYGVVLSGEHHDPGCHRGHVPSRPGQLDTLHCARCRNLADRIGGVGERCPL